MQSASVCLIFIKSVILTDIVIMDGTVYVTAAGLQVLRDNNLIHRDLKPQVWLCLSTYNELHKCLSIAL